MRLSVIFATLVLSSLGYSQIINTQDPDSFQMGYATYLNAGDSSLILSNSGASIGLPGTGNICVNTYVFDTREEMNECCACTVTPDGFRSISAKTDLTKNPIITGTVLTNIIVKLVATEKIGLTCDPTTEATLLPGMAAWGTTLTPAPPAGKTYSAIPVEYKDEPLSAAEYLSLTSTCYFAGRLGSGSGICTCGVSGD
ncbi:MAG: hypothetical protein WB566_19165 [Terriglobales bacterium]